MPEALLWIDPRPVDDDHRPAKVARHLLTPFDTQRAIKEGLQWPLEKIASPIFTELRFM